jgi:hypothetical protein
LTTEYPARGSFRLQSTRSAKNRFLTRNRT